MYPFWDPQPLLCGVPSGLIEHEQDAFSLSRSYFPGEVLQSQRERLRVDSGQDEPVDLSGFRARKGVEVGPFVTLVDLHQRSFSDGAPHLADDRLEAQAMLILTPQLHLCRWVGLLETSHPHRELFLKASCSLLLAFW